ncbi:MAG: hypothetical protein AABX51_03645 [Nanoarchaeota archaeon]
MVYECSNTIFLKELYKMITRGDKVVYSPDTIHWLQGLSNECEHQNKLFRDIITGSERLIESINDGWKVINKMPPEEYRKNLTNSFNLQKNRENLSEIWSKFMGKLPKAVSAGKKLEEYIQNNIASAGRLDLHIVLGNVKLIMRGLERIINLRENLPTSDIYEKWYKTVKKMIGEIFSRIIKPFKDVTGSLQLLKKGVVLSINRLENIIKNNKGTKDDFRKTIQSAYKISSDIDFHIEKYYIPIVV